MSREKKEKHEKQTEVKMLYFDQNDPLQYESYAYLEMVRYYQTKFVSKLVHDYFKGQGLSLKDEYMDIKDNVIAYISNEEVKKPRKANLNCEEIAELVVEKMKPLLGELQTEKPGVNSSIWKHNEKDNAEDNKIPNDRHEDPVQAEENPLFSGMLDGFESMLQ